MNTIKFTRRFLEDSQYITPDLVNDWSPRTDYQHFSGRLTHNLGGVLYQDDITNIIIHHTAVVTQGVRTNHQANAARYENGIWQLRSDGTPYHFFIGPDNINASGQPSANPNWSLKVALGTPLNIVGWHSGREGINRDSDVPSNFNSLSIALSGNFDTQASGGNDPTTLTTIQHNQVIRNLTNLIADCLISYPRVLGSNKGIPRDNHFNTSRRADLGMASETKCGIMGHWDLCINQHCPGRGFSTVVNNCINNAIDLANIHDAVQNLVTAGRVPATTNGVSTAIHWGRFWLDNRNQPWGNALRQFFLSAGNLQRFNVTRVPVNNVATARTMLSVVGLIAPTIGNSTFDQFVRELASYAVCFNLFNNLNPALSRLSENNRFSGTPLEIMMEFGNLHPRDFWQNPNTQRENDVVALIGGMNSHSSFVSSRHPIMPEGSGNDTHARHLLVQNNVISLDLSNRITNFSTTLINRMVREFVSWLPIQ